MATDNHLTIRDYFDQVLLGSTAKRNPISAAKPEAADTDLFHQTLTSCENRIQNRKNLRTTGMTVVDYLKNPVMIPCQFNYRGFSGGSQKTEPKADASHGPAAPLPAGQSTAANTIESSLGSRSQERTNLSAPISRTKQANSNENLRIERSIHRAASRYNLPPGLIRGVIRAESNFQVAAVSRAGAQGLMQLMPETARELGVSDPFDIEQNIDGGARYLRQMLDSFDGDVKTALAAYNAGPGTVEKYGGRIPPYQETEQYIDRVLRFSKQMA